jgi:hypothetical protein
MSIVRARLALAALLALGGCSTPTVDELRQNRQQPSLSDTSDCRAQAQRQAEQRYPRRTSPRGAPLADYANNEMDRFPAELSLFKLCMRSKGYSVS